MFEDSWICAAWSKNPNLRDGLTKEKLQALPYASFGLGPVPLAQQLITMLPNTRFIAVIQRSLGEWASRQTDIRVHELMFPRPRLLFEMSWNAAFSSDLALTWLRGVVTDVVESSFAALQQTS